MQLVGALESTIWFVLFPRSSSQLPLLRNLTSGCTNLFLALFFNSLSFSVSLISGLGLKQLTHTPHYSRLQGPGPGGAPQLPAWSPGHLSPSTLLTDGGIACGSGSVCAAATACARANEEPLKPVDFWCSRLDASRRRHWQIGLLLAWPGSGMHGVSRIGLVPSLYPNLWRAHLQNCSLSKL